MNHRLLVIVVCTVWSNVPVAAWAAERGSGWESVFGQQFTIWQSLPFFAQAAKDPLGLSPEDRKRYDEHMRDADRSLMIGYIAAGLGVACIVVGVALMIYRDCKKKRKSPGG